MSAVRAFGPPPNGISFHSTRVVDQLTLASCCLDNFFWILMQNYKHIPVTKIVWDDLEITTLYRMWLLRQIRIIFYEYCFTTVFTENWLKHFRFGYLWNLRSNEKRLTQGWTLAVRQLWHCFTPKPLYTCPQISFSLVSFVPAILFVTEWQRWFWMLKFICPPNLDILIFTAHLKEKWQIFLSSFTVKCPVETSPSSIRTAKDSLRVAIF